MRSCILRICTSPCRPIRVGGPQGHGPLDADPSRRGDRPCNADLRLHQRSQRPGDARPDRGSQGRMEVAVGGLRGPYKHEQKITGMINDLMNLVAVEKDGAGHDFLEWFCREQVEEEAQSQLKSSQLKLAGDAGLGRYMIDQQLGRHTAKSGREKMMRLLVQRRSAWERTVFEALRRPARHGVSK